MGKAIKKRRRCSKAGENFSVLTGKLLQCAQNRILLRAKPYRNVDLEFESSALISGKQNRLRLRVEIKTELLRAGVKSAPLKCKENYKTKT